MELDANASIGEGTALAVSYAADLDAAVGFLKKSSTRASTRRRWLRHMS